MLEQSRILFDRTKHADEEERFKANMEFEEHKQNTNSYLKAKEISLGYDGIAVKREQIESQEKISANRIKAEKHLQDTKIKFQGAENTYDRATKIAVQDLQSQNRIVVAELDAKARKALAQIKNAG